MPTLSTPLGELRSRYGVVVVGSGYGGAIAAYTMASKAMRDGTAGRPAFSVCVLERGLEIPAGQYPSSFVGAVGQLQVDTRFGHIGRRTGLFDFRVNPDISVLVGCGLGGTSLINAGVMLPPAPDVLNHEAWPLSLRNGNALRDDEFEEIRKALGAGPLPVDVPLLKIRRLFESANPDDPKAGLKGARPPIAVSFRTGENLFGVQQQRCVLCGDCMTGCNHSAKNTTTMNYLPGAAHKGAAIFCGVAVRAIQRIEDGWRLHVRITDRGVAMLGNPDLTIDATSVFLAAGTLGSTEILLRSRKRCDLKVSETLGSHFSGNGDAIAFSYNALEPVEGVGYGEHVSRNAAVGPLIAGMLDERTHADPMMIQEGAIPGVLGPVLRFAAPIMARVTHVRGDMRFDLLFRHLWRELDSLIRGAHHGALLRTQTFLVMSRDASVGTMGLPHDRLRIKWPLAGSQPVFKNISARLAQLTRAMKGRYVINPFWSRLFGRRLVTVHPLGGCRMADSASDGVVDGRGKVFKGTSGTETHDRLYVCDGSIVPLALGTNPALTISALARRIALEAADDVATAAGAATAIDEPPGRVNPSLAGIRYAERLRGRIRLDNVPSPITLVLRISAESLEDLIEQPAHLARIVGMVYAPDLPPGRRQFRVSESTFEVLVDDPVRIDTKLIRYWLTLTSESGEVFWLAGEKTINLENCRRGTWRAITRLSFRMFKKAGTHEKECVTTFSARASARDVIRMVAGMEVTNERRLLRRLYLLLRFGWYFTDALIQARVWALRRTRKTNPFDRPPRVELPSYIRQGQEIVDERKDGPPRFILTPYTDTRLPPGGDPKPVILAPGFGMSTYAFCVGKPSITEYLCEKGYQVWLFDYRASDRLRASLDQFTLDDLALGDFRDAVEAVCENTRQKVRIIAHCVASLTVFMALIKRSLTEKHVHSVILSQSFAFIDHPWINRLKAVLRLPDLLKYLSFRPVLTSDFDIQASFPATLLDRLLYFYPSEERCTEGVCRRLLFMYGPVIRHDRIDRATHDIMYDLFDRANLTTFSHLAKMIASGRIVDHRGKNTYLIPGNGKHIRVPITLLQGMQNRLFRPRGARATLDWLIKHGPYGHDNADMFTLVKLENHGHLDTFIGRDVARPHGSFDSIATALESMESRRPGAARELT